MNIIIVINDNFRLKSRFYWFLGIFSLKMFPVISYIGRVKILLSNGAQRGSISYCREYTKKIEYEYFVFV